MKPVFECEYCTFMGTEEEVAAHENICISNYNKKSCWTCEHREFLTIKQLKCSIGEEIPANSIIENCDKYEQKERPKLNRPLFDSFFRF